MYFTILAVGMFLAINFLGCFHTCLLWSQLVDEFVNLYFPLVRFVFRYRTIQVNSKWIWEEFFEAMEEDFRTALKRFWQTLRRPRRG